MAAKKFMTWDKFDRDIDEFIDYIKEYEFDKNTVILAVKRGGFPTSTALSNKLNIPISVVSYQTRDGNSSKPKFLEPELIENAEKIIIPDDIYDSGKTVETIIDELENNFGIPVENIAGLFHYSSDNIPRTKLGYYRCTNHNEGSWIVYPWEQ